MEIDQLRTLLSVLEHGSFSRAAEAMRLAQSTVSFHIKALETIVGARLLDRQGGAVRPTASGALLRRYAIRLLSLREEALERLRAQEEGQAGRVAIAASTIPAEYLLPQVLATFRKDHPRVAVVVTVSDSRKAVAALVAHECDLALVGAPVGDRRIVSTPFAEDEIVLVGPVPNPFAPSNRLTEEQLRRVPLIVREDGSGTRQAVARVLARRTAPDRDLASTIEVGSTEAAKNCARHGVGLAFVSRRAVVDEVKLGRLSLVTVPGLPTRRRFYAARLRHVTLPVAARTLLTLIIQQYR